MAIVLSTALYDALGSVETYSRLHEAVDHSSHREQLSEFMFDEDVAVISPNDPLIVGLSRSVHGDRLNSPRHIRNRPVSGTVLDEAFVYRMPE